MSQIAHILTIKPDGPEDWLWDITCPYRGGLAVGGHVDDVYDMVCRTYWECRHGIDHSLTDDEQERLDCDGYGPCAESPNGMHYELSGGGPFIPTKSCWMSAVPDASDVVQDVHAEYGIGTFVVSVGWEDGESIQLNVLASVEEGLGGVAPLDVRESEAS